MVNDPVLRVSVYWNASAKAYVASYTVRHAGKESVRFCKWQNDLRPEIDAWGARQLMAACGSEYASWLL